MSARRKHRKKAVFGLAVILLAVFLGMISIGLETEAGFGDFNDYDSGSDYGGGSDYDSGNVWDSGSDWDSSDWDGSGDGSVRGDHSIISLIIVVFIYFPIIFVLVWREKKRRRNTSNPRQVRNTVHKSTRTLPDRTNEISKVIQEKDPDFTAPDFLSFAKKVYMDIQDAWEKRDLRPVITVLHQNLYQQTEKQIAKKIADGIVNHLERISINTAYLTSFRRDAQYEYLTIYLAASMIDYQIREATGEILYGDRTTRWNMYYKMTFMRFAGTRTRSADEKHRGMVCPNCGAPLKGTSFGQCEYCGNTVTTGEYDWVLSDFGVVKEDTVDEGIVIDR